MINLYREIPIVYAKEIKKKKLLSNLTQMKLSSAYPQCTMRNLSAYE